MLWLKDGQAVYSKELSTSINILPELCNFCSYGTLTTRVLLCSFQSLDDPYGIFQLSLNIRPLERVIFLSHHWLLQW